MCLFTVFECLKIGLRYLERSIWKLQQGENCSHLFPPAVHNREPGTWNLFPALKAKCEGSCYSYSCLTSPRCGRTSHLAVRTLMTSDWAAIFMSVGWQTALIVCDYTIETFPSWMRSLGLVCDKAIDSNLESKRCGTDSLCHRHEIQRDSPERQVRSQTGNAQIF